ncbi:MAG: hypothetical protein H7836_10025 [Magnetococcus sp. YQC-3]
MLLFLCWKSVGGGFWGGGRRLVHGAVGGWSTGCGLGGWGGQAWFWWHTGGGVAWLETVASSGGVKMLVGVDGNGDVE